MSKQYPGGIISKNPVTPSGSFENSTAPGIWTLEQQAYWQKLGQWPIPGNTQNFIEDVFSTYLYTGNGSTQTITNGIDLAGKGGLVWLKNRTGGSGPHNWYTTAIGSASYLDSSQTSGLATYQEALSTYNSDGFSLSSGAAGGNENTFTYASWTFREQAKFFDVVTYTGDGTSNRSISHSLGSTPGCIIIKRTDSSDSWIVWHRAMYSDPSILYEYYLRLNSTAAIAATYNDIWGNSNNVTSTSFQVSVSDAVNASGGTYVAYLFAHDAGGFGLTGTDNVISCGSYTEPASSFTDINLGYEVQWLLTKSTTTGDWVLTDIMQGMSETSISYLKPNSSAATTSFSGSYLVPTATGFRAYSGFYGSGTNLIYIAIRRGPMKVPTSGTSVFNTQTYSGTSSNQTLTTGFPVSQYIIYNRGGGTYAWFDRLRGQIPFLDSASTAAENTSFTTAEMPKQDSNTGITLQAVYFNTSGQNRGIWAFQRAPGFFDEVCYTGTGSATTQTHNLGVVPEMMIVKRRNSTGEWKVYFSALGNNNELVLNSTGNIGTTDAWNNTTPTSSVFSIGSPLDVSSGTYVAYLFATCAGVSKVGSYTGTGTTLQIDCGFTGGARFVLIKRSDNSGSPQNWYVWDSARGIVAGDDPYLLLNSTAAEVTNTDYVDTYSAGFEITSTAPAAINGSGGTFIFLAIA